MAEKPPTLALQLYVTGLWATTTLVAEEYRPLNLASAEEPQQIQLRPKTGPGATFYSVVLSYPDQSPVEGWWTFRAGLTVDNWTMGVVPLAMYLGDPDDFHSGMARYVAPFEWTKADREWFTGEPQDGPTQAVWILTARRSG